MRIRKVTAVLIAALMVFGTILGAFAESVKGDESGLKKLDAVWARLDTAEAEAVAAGADASAVTMAVYRAALQTDAVDAGSFNSVTPTSFFFTVDGMHCAYDYAAHNFTPSEEELEQKAIAVPGTRSGSANANVLLIRPSSGYDGNLTNCFPTVAASVAEVTGGSYTALQGTSATGPAIAEAVSNAGVILIESYGIQSGTSSYIFLTSNEGITVEDYTNGWAVNVSSYAYIDGRYIQNHVSSPLPNSFIWCSASEFMKSTGLGTSGSALLTAGAAAVFGYSQVETYAGRYLHVETFWNAMNNGATVAEAFAEMADTHGVHDPYGEAYPVIMSAVDPYPDDPDSPQTVNCDWKLSISGQEPDPTPEPTEEPTPEPMPAIMFYEDFSTSSEAAGWLRLDLDGNGSTWLRSAHGSGHSGSGYLYSADDNAPEDNWAITPPVDIGSGAAVCFFTKNSNSYSNTLRVYAGTSPNPDAMVPVTDPITVTGSDAWMFRCADLSAFADQTVYVGFRNCTDQNAGSLYLDDVYIASAFSGECGEGLHWRLTFADGMLDITGSGSMNSYNCSDFSTRPPWYDCRKYVNAVRIDEGATGVGSSAFCNCSSLTQVTFPSTLTSIYPNAFMNCTSLETVTFPVGVRTIGSGAFSNAPQLSAAYFLGEPPESLSATAFTDTASGFTLYYPVALASTWAPNGETTFAGYAIAPYGYVEITPEPTAEPDVHVVTFVDWDGLVLKSEPVWDGGSAAPPAVPGREGYNFIGWSGSYENIHYNTVLVAQYELIPVPTSEPVAVWLVVFVDWNGVYLGAATVENGGTAVAPVIPEREGYAFTGWDADLTNVTENLVVTAQYERIPDGAEVGFTVAAVRALPGRQAEVSLNISGEYAASGLTVELSYDPELLTLAEAGLAAGELWESISDLGGTVVTNTNTAGTIRFMAILPSSPLTGSGELFVMRFNVSGSAQPNVSIPVTLEVKQFYYSEGTDREDIAYVVTDGALNVFASPGDVNGDGVLDSFDALLIMRHALEMIELDHEALVFADFDGDGEIDSFDALLVMRKALGLI